MMNRRRHEKMSLVRVSAHCHDILPETYETSQRTFLYPSAKKWTVFFECD